MKRSAFAVAALLAAAPGLDAAAHAQPAPHGHRLEAVLPLGAMALRASVGMQVQRDAREALWRHDVESTLGATYGVGETRWALALTTTRALGGRSAAETDWHVMATANLGGAGWIETRLGQVLNGATSPWRGEVRLGRSF